MAALAAEQVRTTLRRSWQCKPGSCIPLGRDAWQVEINGGQFVGKWVPMGRRSVLEAGLCAHFRLAAARAAARIHDGGGRLEDHGELTRLAALYTQLSDAM